MDGEVLGAVVKDESHLNVKGFSAFRLRPEPSSIKIIVTYYENGV